MFPTGGDVQGLLRSIKWVSKIQLLELKTTQYKLVCEAMPSIANLSALKLAGIFSFNPAAKQWKYLTDLEMMKRR